MDFNGSSHRTRWIFSSDQLQKLREEALNRLIPSGLESNFPSDKHQHSRAGSPEDQLSADEEKVLVKQYSKTIAQQFGQFLQQLSGGKTLLSHYIVKWTAVTLFRRYYLYHTMAGISPKEIMMGCMLLASKAEDCRLVSLSNLLEWKDRYTPVQVTEAELAVIAGVQFDLVIFNPLVALGGLLDTIKQKCKECPEDQHVISISNALKDDSLKGAFMQDIETLMLTDALFLFSPSEIALAVVQRKFPDSLPSLLNVSIQLEPFDQFFNEPPVDKGTFASLDKRLEATKCQLFNRESPEYKAAQDRRQSMMMAKSEAKHQKIEQEQQKTLLKLKIIPSAAKKSNNASTDSNGIMNVS